jgi:hypothetical protein
LNNDCYNGQYYCNSPCPSFAFQKAICRSHNRNRWEIQVLFEDDHDLSIDNSRKIVESFSNAEYYCYPDLTEIDKRNKYLEIAGSKEVDFLLVIDSDKYAVIDINEFSRNLAKIKEYKTGAPVNGKSKDTPDVYGYQNI